MASVDLSVLREKGFWRAVFVEFFATTLFLYFVTALLVTSPDLITISFGIGLAIAILAHVFGPISGGHFNTAITIGTIVTGDVSIVKAVCYIMAQVVGGILGSGITFALNPADKRGQLGNCAIAKGYSNAQAFAIEMVLTAVLVFAFLAASSSDNNRKNWGFGNAFAVGITITVCHFVGVPYTGSGINPARVFGPAVVRNIWHSYHWVYWVAPIVGGILAGLIYKYIIKIDFGPSEPINENSPLVKYDSTTKVVDYQKLP